MYSTLCNRTPVAPGLYFTSCHRAPVAPGLYFTSCNAAPVPTGLYFKITNSAENHHNFQYVNGLNVLKDKFNDDPSESCCPGGLYFTNAENIFKFLDYGIYLREITLPTENPDFRLVADDDKWRANMIILGERRDLSNIDTFKYLITQGANIHTSDNYALAWSARKGYLDIVRLLVNSKVDINAGEDLALVLAAQSGHLDVVQFLVEHGANIHSRNNGALRWSVVRGHLNILQYLIKKGVNVGYDNNCVLLWAAQEGHADIAQYCIENGADIRVLKHQVVRGNVVQYLATLNPSLTKNKIEC